MTAWRSWRTGCSTMLRAACKSSGAASSCARAWCCIAVPTLITGYLGMNVPYPGFGEKAGFAASIAAMALPGLVLYLIFKRKDWL
jgi:Na+-driven multidrug efflux pump